MVKVLSRTAQQEYTIQNYNNYNKNNKTTKLIDVQINHMETKPLVMIIIIVIPIGVRVSSVVTAAMTAAPISNNTNYSILAYVI